MKYSKILLIITIISCILATACTLMLSTNGFFGNNLFDEFTKGKLSAEAEMLVFFLIVALFSFLLLNISYLPFYILKAVLFTKDTINKQYIDTKKSIYTRDLPEYNSAVAGEIMDFKTTFEEEYIAGVIELISKGYIIEHEGRLIVDDSKPREGLLKNEKYILETCVNIHKDLYLITNYQFYKELKEDMYDLGLYKRITLLKKIKNKISYYLEKERKESFTIKHYIILMMTPLLIFTIIQNFYLMIILYLLIIVFIRKNKLTKKGELEKERVSKLKLFLEKETNFKEKEKNERELWGRYSAFAVAFGLNTEMKEDIRTKLINK